MRRLYSAAGFSDTHIGDRADFFAGRRVDDVVGGATVGVFPLAVDVALHAQEVAVGQFHAYFSSPAR